MIVGNTCYAFDENLNRTPICRINNRIEDYRKISIGINVSKYSAGRLPEKLSLFVQIQPLSISIMYTDFCHM